MTNLLGVPIFCYHSIAENPLSVPPWIFRKQMSYLKKAGVRVISLGGLLEEFRSSGALSRLVCVTFDDGFESTYLHAFPILRGLGFSATFFVTVGYVGQRLWGIPEAGRWSAERGVGRTECPIVTWEQVRELQRAGMEVGSHTMTHPNLTELSEKAARSEIAESKKELEDQIGVEVRVFAYPRGQCTPRLARLVETSGYFGACTTQRGYATQDYDRYLLPRLAGGSRVADLVCDVRGFRPNSLAGWLLRAGGAVDRAVHASKGQRL